MKYRWHITQTEPDRLGELARQLGISPLLARCLANRGLCQPAAAAHFLKPRLHDLEDPFLIPNMHAAVERLFQAREKGEKLVIFGDYDVDGVTSTALLWEVLRALGWQAQCFLPHRLEEGYGLTRASVEKCLEKHPSSLLLAVDCGSTSVEAIAWLKTLGVETIVLDHHQIASPAPSAVALVNPRLALPETSELSLEAAEPPAYAWLCSAGLAFKMAHALVKHGRENGLAAAQTYDIRPLLDLVALGTIADLVPLRGENRILVAAGMDRLNATQRPGLQALKAVAQSVGPLGASGVAYQLAPRLNAAGRLEDAEVSLRLLQADSAIEAEALARDLDARNQERQAIERAISTEAIGAVRASFDPIRDFVIVEGRGPWHVGVVGIVASRVTRQFHRPTIIVGGDGPAWRGSGRSIDGFDLAFALGQCTDLLLRHGGHALAAGLTIKPENLPPFRERLNSLARSLLQPEQLQPRLDLDAEARLDEITIERLQELTLLEPMGQGNPPVQVAIARLQCPRPPVRIGKEQQHLKFWVTDGRFTHEAVWWNPASADLPAGRFDLACQPRINDFNGRRTVQLQVLDCRPAATN